MILELTDAQKAFQTSIEQFAREIVAQRAAGIDKSGEYPTDVMHAAGAHAAWTPRPGHHGVSRPDGHIRHPPHSARRFARRPRPRLHGSRPRSDGGRR